MARAMSIFAEGSSMGEASKLSPISSRSLILLEKVALDRVVDRRGTGVEVRGLCLP